METVKLNGTTIQGGGLKYAVTPQIVLGDESNGYTPGTILDANEVKSLSANGGGASNTLVNSTITQSYSKDKRQNVNNTAITLGILKSNQHIYSSTADIISGYNIASKGFNSILCGFGILNTGAQNIISANSYILKIESIDGNTAISSIDSSNSMYSYLNAYDVYMVVGRYINGLEISGEAFSPSTLKKVTFGISTNNKITITNAAECGITKPGIISMFTTSNNGNCSILVGENRGNYTCSISVGTYNIAEKAKNSAIFGFSNFIGADINGSLVSGANNKSYRNAQLITGYNNKSNINFASVFGAFSNTVGDGKYNDVVKDAEKAKQSSLFTIGNGQSDTLRSNALDIRVNGDVYLVDGTKLQDVLPIKPAATRPTNPVLGQMFFDTTKNKPIWYGKTGWVDATGAAV